MSRRMDYTIAFDAPPQEIYQAFTGREYWQALMDEYSRYSPAGITSFSSDDSGTDITFVQELPRSDLPQIVRAVLPGDLVVTRTQHFDPFDTAANSARGTFGASIPVVPGRFTGTSLLTQTGTGSRQLLSTECHIRIPLVGGALEDLILQHLGQLFDQEESFTASWIAARR